MTTATLTKVERWGALSVWATKPVVRWRLDLSDGRTKIVATRREARQWCAEMGVTITATADETVR